MTIEDYRDHIISVQIKKNFLKRLIVTIETTELKNRLKLTDLLFQICYGIIYSNVEHKTGQK